MSEVHVNYCDGPPWAIPESTSASSKQWCPKLVQILRQTTNERWWCLARSTDGGRLLTVQSASAAILAMVTVHHKHGHGSSQQHKHLCVRWLLIVRLLTEKAWDEKMLNRCWSGGRHGRQCSIYPSRSEVSSSYGIITCSASGKCSRSVDSVMSSGKLPM